MYQYYEMHLLVIQYLISFNPPKISELFLTKKSWIESLMNFSLHMYSLSEVSLIICEIWSEKNYPDLNSLRTRSKFYKLSI